jgi:hypothetical protein
LFAAALGDVLRRLTYSVLSLATAGFLAALMVHVAAISGKTYPFDLSSDYLFAGLFLVWIPTGILMNLSSGHKQGARWQGWRVVLRGCPKFLQWAMWILSGYAGVYIVLPFIYRHDVGSPLYNARSVSSVFLAIYSAAACVLYSLTQSEKFDEGRPRIEPLA